VTQSILPLCVGAKQDFAFIFILFILFLFVPAFVCYNEGNHQRDDYNGIRIGCLLQNKCSLPKRSLFVEQGQEKRKGEHL
jgi:hypothetical protein